MTAFQGPVAIPFTMNTQLSSPQPDNRIVADQNELKVLNLVRNFGHLRRAEIARGVWHHSKATVADRMTQRTVARLTKNRELIERSNGSGGKSLLLGRRGASRLREKGFKANTGYDLSSVEGLHYKHRSYATRYLMERIAQGHGAYGEYALANRYCPITRAQLVTTFKKVPDGLVLVPGPDRGWKDNTITAADWIEVENSTKSTEELARILDIAWRIGECLDAAKSVMLDRVVFVFDKTDGHEDRIKKALKTYLRERAPANRDHLLASIFFCRCSVDAPFTWRGCEEVDCAKVLQEDTLTR